MCAGLRFRQAKRAADAEANAKRELERAKAREVAALGAQREIERLRLEEARRKLEAVSGHGGTLVLCSRALG